MKDAQIELMGDLTELILSAKCVLIDHPDNRIIQQQIKDYYYMLWNAYDEGL